MLIGKLDRYVRVEKPTLVIDPTYGSRTITWAAHIEGWANVQDIMANNQEASNTDLRLATRPCKVMMRFNSSIDATMRLVMLDRENRILQIVSVPAEFGRREFTEFMCEQFSA